MKNRKTVLPAIIDMDEVSEDTFITYYKANKKQFESLLLENGALKFKGVQIDSIDSFRYVVNSISEKFLNYIDGTSPRTKLIGNIYTSTEYDNTQRITMHNELSYSAKWPNKLFFSCLEPSTTGGETLLADSAEMLRQIDKSIAEELYRKGITYIRNLNDGQGIGSSWQQTFETEDKFQAEAYCKSLGISFEWTSKNNLRLIQNSKGIIKHRITGEQLWFNQIDQFHPSQLGEEVHEALKSVYEFPEEYPTYVRYGDGTVIHESVIAEIIHTAASITEFPVWKRHELLIVDNEAVSHGRNWYTGERKVLVSMSE